MGVTEDVDSCSTMYQLTKYYRRYLWRWTVLELMYCDVHRLVKLEKGYLCEDKIMFSIKLKENLLEE